MGADSELNVARHAGRGRSTPIQLPLSRTMQFRESNLETIQLVNGPTDFDGVLTDSAGSVIGAVVELRLGKRPRAAAGKSRRRHRRRAGHASPRAGASSPLYSLEAELVPQPLAAARRLGLSG